MITFLKPVQTGFPEDSDARLVVCGDFVVGLDLTLSIACATPFTCSQALASGAAQLLEPHAARLSQEQKSYGELDNHSIAKTMFAWTAPVSPHAASAAEGSLSYCQGPPWQLIILWPCICKVCALPSLLHYYFDHTAACSSCSCWTLVQVTMFQMQNWCLL